jgi:hypothetical protein
MDRYTLSELLFPGSHNSLIMDLEIKKKIDRRQSIFNSSYKTQLVNSRKVKRKKTSIIEGITSYLNPEVCPYKMFEFNLQTIEFCKFFPFCIELDLILENAKCLFGHLNNKCEFSIEEFLTATFNKYIELNNKNRGIVLFPLIITLDFKKTSCFCTELKSCCSIIGKILTKVIDNGQKEFVEVSGETRNKKYQNEVSDRPITQLFNKIIFRLKKSDGDFIDFFETNNIIYINNSGGLSLKFKNNSSKKVKLKHLKKSKKKTNSITRIYPSNLPTKFKPYKHYRPNNLSLLVVLTRQLDTPKNIYDGNQYHNIISFDFDRVFLNYRLFIAAKKYFIKLASLYNQFFDKTPNNISFDKSYLDTILTSLHKTITHESVYKKSKYLDGALGRYKPQIDSLYQQTSMPCISKVKHSKKKSLNKYSSSSSSSSSRSSSSRSRSSSSSSRRSSRRSRISSI